MTRQQSRPGFGLCKKSDHGEKSRLLFMFLHFYWGKRKNVTK